MIIDHVNSVGGILNVRLDKNLMRSVHGAIGKPTPTSSQTKSRMKLDCWLSPEKRVADELEELKAKKRRLETDYGSLIKTADEFA